MVQLTLAPVVNENLFTKHYLEERIKELPEWQEDGEIEKTFDEIKEIYEKRKDRIKTYTSKEAQLEKDFIRPVLEVLGHFFAVRATIQKTAERPDYGFFETEGDLDEALKNEESKGFYENSIAVGDAKAWNKDLDKKIEGKPVFENKNPSFQIDHYLRTTSPAWGILTNGRKWRLYYEEVPHPIGTYYEVDLVDILENDGLEKFKYFYLFFRKQAFTPTGNSFLDRIYERSETYSREIGEDLEGNVYQALLWMAKGYFAVGTNNLEKTKENVKMVHDNSLIFLYRLLFLLYADSKELLPSKQDIHRKYYDYSIANWIDEILEKKDKDNLPPGGTKYYFMLSKIFRLVREGSEELNIPKEDFHVPAYNGGLFDNEKHLDNEDRPFFDNYQIQDEYLAKVVDLLTRVQSEKREEKARVDYSDLSLRHLGGIYEGLLEYKLKLADEDLVAEKENRALKWIPVSESKKDFSEFDEDKRTREEELYLVTDKGERKATGSYYTPDYIVNYIVENTVGPVIEDKLEDAETEEEKRRAILSTNVLDPAMGSGHFLVETINFLAERLAEFAENGGDERGYDWAKREVARNCIYGVDVNPLATELAKVSLWLNTMAEDKPLSFLDHHLKTGNSLIGADLHKLGKHPKKLDEIDEEKEYAQQTLYGKSFQENIKELLGKLKEIRNVTEETPEDIKEEEQLLQEFEDHSFKKKFDVLADVQTSYYFGNEFSKSQYSKLLDVFRVEDIDEKVWEKLSQKEWVRKASDSVPQEKEYNLSDEEEFFHWKLEFPEVFFDIEKGTEKETPGFEAVIGNPPYVRQEIITQLKEYLQNNYEVYTGRGDLYSYFLERANEVSSDRVGYIVSHKFTKVDSGEPLRKYIINNTSLEEFIDFQDLPVFGDDVSTYPAIMILSKKSKDEKFKYAQFMNLEFENLSTKVTELSKRVPMSILGEKEWKFISETEQGIRNKVLQIGEKLSNLVGEPLVGVKTGLNEVYMVEKEEIEEIIEENYERNVFKPFIKGKEIKRYKKPNPERFLLFPYEKNNEKYEPINLEEYPGIDKYLRKNKHDLASRYDIKNSSQKWYELRACNYYDKFEREKIIYPDISKEANFTIDKGTFVDMTGFILDTDSEFYLGLLNSSLLQWFISIECAKARGGYLRFKTQYMNNIPLISGQKDSNLTSKVEQIMENRGERTKINLNIEDYLGNYSKGQTLGDLYTPVSGVSDTALTDTKADRDNLKLGRIEFEERNGELILKTSAKYKPENEDEFDDLDRWGYAETESIPAMKFSGSKEELSLIREFTKLAIEEAGGFAKFRKKATKTTSLIDRLEKLTLPKLEDVELGLMKYLEQREKAEKLEKEIQETDDLIDAIVFNLYDLNDDEVEVVLDSLDTEGEIKQDILDRFREFK